MTDWKQFTLYPPGCRNKFQPAQALHVFLPRFLRENGSVWLYHLLFEPSALVRFKAGADNEAVMSGATRIALDCGLVLEPGDASVELNPRLSCADENWDDSAEVAFYGADLWRVNCEFMMACSNLAIEVLKLDHQRQVWMMRKFNHLYLNALGLNFLEEMALGVEWSERAKLRYHDHGRS